MADVNELMKQYFSNKLERNKIKKERYDFMLDFKCEGEDCIRDGTEEIDFCDACKKRHSFYTRLQKLSHANAGIMNRVRNSVMNQPTN